MDPDERVAITDLLKTVRIGLIVMAIVGGYASKDVLMGVI